VVQLGEQHVLLAQQGPQPRAVLFACAQLAVQQHEKQPAVTHTKNAPL
jgi:hypothetical protein